MLGDGSAESESGGLRSAYEAALERLEEQGISKPDRSALSETARRAMAEARSKAEARLAELEIMHDDKLRGLGDPQEREKAEERYRNERRRIERALEAELDRLRGSG